MKPIAIIFYYTRQNRYSINSLLGSIQQDELILKNADIYLPHDEQHLILTLQLAVGKEYKKIILAFSFTSMQCDDVEKILINIKSLFITKNFIFIAGGPHPTGAPESTLKLGFDICFIGEAEETFVNFLHCILQEKHWYDLPSIAFVDNNKNFVINKRTTHFIDLDKYPPISSYFNCYGPIEITRGCPYCCYYCQTPQIFGTKLRHRSVQKICELVETMATKGLYDTRFITPSLFLYGSEDGKKLNLVKIEELFNSVSKIIKPKGKLFIGTFPSEIRPEHINKDTVELLKKYADNDNVIVGAQSGSDRILELCHRRHTVSDVYNAVQLLTKTGFKVNLDFIFGLPYEEQKDVKQTVKLIDELTTKYKVRIHAHIFIPLVGTKFQNCVRSQICKLENLEFYIKYCKQLKNKGLLYGDWEKQLEYVKPVKIK